MRRIKTDCWAENDDLWAFRTLGNSREYFWRTISFMGVL